jgi:hypothetical protein
VLSSQLEEGENMIAFGVVGGGWMLDWCNQTIGNP